MTVHYIGRVPEDSISDLLPDRWYCEDISALKQLLAKGNFSEIAQNPKLFWQAFCQAFDQVGKGRDMFSASILGRELNISGDKRVILAIKGFMEEMRKLFVKGYSENGDFGILAVKYGRSYFVREKVDTAGVLGRQFLC